MKYEITKLGIGAVVGVLVIGFSAVGLTSLYNTQQVASLTEKVQSLQVKPSPEVVVVTPTNVPTATPSAVLHTPVHVTPKSVSK